MCTRICFPLFLTILLVPCAVSAADDENWPRFRGPHANGVSADDERLPDTWSTTENVVWKIDIPGWGWSSPVIWENKVFLTSVVSDAENEAPKKGLYLGRGRSDLPKGLHHWQVFCMDLHSGELLWKQEVHVSEPKFPRHPKNTYAAETPTTDGRRLYVLFGDLGLYCFDIAGKPLWSQPISTKKTFYDYGAAGSPVVHGDQVFMIYDNQEDSYIAAFDTQTGKERWRTPRDEKSTWATPFVWQNELRTEIVTAGKNRIRSYDLDGKMIWDLDGRMSNLIIPSPFATEGLLYITSGYFADQRRPVYAIKAGAAGDITLEKPQSSSEFIQWFKPKLGPYNTSPIVYKGNYYTVYDMGLFSANNALTGESLIDRERFPRGASFTASPWAYNNKIFCLSENGTTYVMKPGAEFEILHTNKLDEFCMASPAVSQGKLLIRTASKLYCISQSK